jgi:LysM repeat protein
MNQPHGRFCQLYRPIGALLLLLAILFLLLRSYSVQTPVAAVPTVEPTRSAAPTVAPTLVPTVSPTLAPTLSPTLAPTSAPPTALPTALPELNVPAAADYTADGVKLSGTGQPGATVEVWEGAIKLGTAVVGSDGTWSLVAKLGEGAHKLAVRTVDAAGKTLNESPAVDVTVPKAIALPELNVPAAADTTADGVKLSGTGQPGATVEVWEGATKLGTAVVGSDGTWTLVARLGEGAHKLAVRTVDAAGTMLNESPAVDVTVPTVQVLAATEDLAASGEAYTIQPGDWLMKLSRRFYGDPGLYTRIIDGTNAKAIVDPTFARITNPNLILAWQKLWIPAKPASD